MSLADASVEVGPQRAATGSGLSFRRLDAALLALTLAALVVLPLVHALLRLAGRPGLPAAGSLVQHLTLIVGMLGGVLAARAGRLLSLSTLTTFLGERARGAARLYAGAWTVAISALLCAASIDLVRVERIGGKQLAWGIPI